jgi:predicted deacylase
MKRIYQLYQLFLKQLHDDIPGVICIDTGRPGPVVGITACTHANEPSGLYVLDYLLNEFDIQKKMLSGKLFLVINNLAGVKKYFEAKSEEEKQRARFLDVNMNRLPENVLSLVGDALPYELRRVQELYPLYATWDYALDIHSTTQESEPIMILGGTLERALLKNIPAPNIIASIDKIQIGVPAFHFFGGVDRSIPIIELESGSHENPLSFAVAIQSTLAFLANTGAIPHLIGAAHEPKQYNYYEIIDSVVLPNESYVLVRPFKMWEFISANTLLARGDQADIFSATEGHVIMPPKGICPSNYQEEVFFLSRRVESITLQ